MADKGWRHEVPWQVRKAIAGEEFRKSWFVALCLGAAVKVDCKEAFGTAYVKYRLKYSRTRTYHMRLIKR
jgi:hypothetical protein